MSNFCYKDSDLQMDSRLVLCIEEHDSKKDKKSIDNRLFIGWSNKDNDYFIRGKRQDIGKHEFVPYSFRCKSSNDLYDFIQFTIGGCKTTSLVLYNFNNMYNFYDDDFTYEFFEENIDRNYEIAAYDNIRINSYIKKYLRMLKNMYNWENSSIIHSS